METTSLKLTVFFEDPFWVGVFERSFENKYEVCKIVFGAEPKDYEVFERYLREYKNLNYSGPKRQAIEIKIKANPKRLQRAISKEMSLKGIETKAQKALKDQYEQNKQYGKILKHERSEQEKRFQYELKVKKRKEKRKGR